jgi:crossover junction endodeoxyribonuclease RuvC
MTQRNILGVDPGLDRTGYAVVSPPDSKIVDAGVIRSTPRRPLPQRLSEIEAGIEEVLSEHAVGLLVVEDLFAHYHHPRTAILMGHARGVVLLAAARRGIDVLNVSATMIKKMLTGNGHASKVQVQRAIMATFGLSSRPEPPDVADALAAASYAVFTQRRP